ncbi:MAG: DUF4342 domain-containing protein, partial [Propionibacteriaceae bacterium]|nr:DUF4342 domain-containing protein [Propionibacteriaceae bacterium]
MTEPTPETPVEEFSVSGENLADKVKETAEKVKDAFSCDGDYVAQEEKLKEQLGGISEEIKCDGHGLVDAVKGIIDAGNARRITIKNEQGDEIITFPLTAG